MNNEIINQNQDFLNETNNIILNDEKGEIGR